jgi:predicted dehydrogenase
MTSAMSLSRADESKPIIRVGLVGYGLAGSAFHAPLIATTSGLRLDVIVTSDATRQADAVRAYPGVQILDTPDALWRRAHDLDLVVLATPNRTHAPLSHAALAVGLPVVVDKPFAATADAARALIADAGERKLMLTVYQNRRWDGDFLTVRQLDEKGAFGKIFRFESRFERWRPTPKLGWRERSDPAEAGGILYDLGSHLIDQAILLLGDVDSVYAQLDRRRRGVEVEDDVFVALTHRSGAQSHLWMSAVAALSGPRFQVLGDKAAYIKFGLDVQEDALRRGERPGAGDWGAEPRERWGTLGAGDHLETIPTRQGAYQGFYEGVVRSLRDGTPPPVDPSDAARGLDIIAAARRSAEQKAVIQIR